MVSESTCSGFESVHGKKRPHTVSCAGLCFESEWCHTQMRVSSSLILYQSQPIMRGMTRREKRHACSDYSYIRIKATLYVSYHGAAGKPIKGPVSSRKRSWRFWICDQFSFLQIQIVTVISSNGIFSQLGQFLLPSWKQRMVTSVLFLNWT